MTSLLRSRWANPILTLICLIPAFWLGWGAWRDKLGLNPIEAITHATGEWTIRFLMLTLAVTPLRRIFGWHDLVKFRRTLGLIAFFYACCHLMTWAWLDKFFDWNEMWADIVKRRFITVGMLALLLMIPLALTSTKGAIRRLGRNWQRLHRLVYVSAALGVVHYYWLVKSDVRWPLFYGGVLAILLGFRVVWAQRHPAPARRVAVQAVKS